MTTTGYSLQPIKDITDELPKNKNYSWKQLCGERVPEQITTIVVHHTGSLKALGADAARHAKNHIEGTSIHVKGEPGLPYHVYCKEGQIYQTNDLLDFVYGVSDNNGYTVHICTEGNFLYDTFTELDRIALYAAILAVKAVLPIVDIKGHNELQAKACPAIDMSRVRSDIKTIEMDIERKQSTLEAQIERCFAVKNQAEFMYNKAKLNDGDGVWARTWLDRVHAIMVEQKLL
ncbi:hypothetical protein A8708_26360 [Paenibacillus oryzisoli]|uniref:N-acetylmuramoyl-L-alanine amidase domain-containing protein n=1 Tax=Paenibacillus oryzisoli TaxID=1850517 RepID=A0A198ADH5_9BACL|nr:hypothetical protein A8708_26360 [Paenibacillus oryzisoli]